MLCSFKHGKSTVAHKGHLFFCKLIEFVFTFHRGINVFSAEICFPPRKKVFTPRRKRFSTEICFPPRKKSLYSEEKTFLRGNIFFTAENDFSHDFSPGEKHISTEKSFPLRVKTFFHGGKHISAEKSFLLRV